MQLVGRSVFKDVRKTAFQVRTFFGPVTRRNSVQMARFGFKRMVRREHVAASVVLSVTRACMCKCVHCFVSDQEIDERLDTDRVIGMIDELAAWGVLKIQFFGGEPTMRPDLFQLMRHATSRGLRIGLSTNGILLDRAYVDELHRIGLSNVQLSLDSADRRAHDALRRYPGCYDLALRAVAELRRVDIPVMISTYATHKNVNNGDLVRLIQLARDIGATGITILPAVLAGAFEGAERAQLTDQDMRTIYALGDPTFVFLEDTYTQDNPVERKCVCAKKEVFYISPEGEVQPCPAIPVSFGNAHEGSIRAAADHMWSDEMFHRTNTSVDGCVINDPWFRDKNLSGLKGAVLQRRYAGMSEDELVYARDGALPPCGMG